MRTIINTFNVYTFDELSNDAKENAINSFRYNDNLSWQDEAVNTIEKIAAAMNCDAEWYSYDGIKYYEIIKTGYEDNKISRRYLYNAIIECARELGIYEDD